jgi:hypothetical protein
LAKTLVMSTVLLISERDDGAYLTARRVRLRDRVAARVRAFGLDAALMRGVTPESSPALALRAQILVGPAIRQQLAADVQQILRHARADGRPSVHAAPISHRLVRSAEPELRRLALRLLDDRAVDVRGIAAVRMLLCDGCGPLFNGPHGNARELQNAVSETLDALEPRC